MLYLHPKLAALTLYERVTGELLLYARVEPVHPRLQLLLALQVHHALPCRARRLLQKPSILHRIAAPRACAHVVVCICAAVGEAESAEARTARALAAREGGAAVEAFENGLASRAARVHHCLDLLAYCNQRTLLRLLLSFGIRVDLGLSLRARLARVRRANLGRRPRTLGDALEAEGALTRGAMELERVALAPREAKVAAGVRAGTEVLHI
mmetsp:Transcript_52610/g.136234  ORF Transcript_52610/g.136234 Transcript_52610/m.136234 type:complete len:211 (-) Transcript_52610:440-1072(-)